MATSILAIIRAAAPAFRNRPDQLAFAVHAAVLNQGFRLVAVGDAAELDGLQLDAPDASVAGWNNSSEQYCFAYLSDDEAAPAASSPAGTPAAPAATKLLLKAIVLGDTLLTTLATDKPSVEPRVLELPFDEYVASSSTSSTSSSSGGGAAKGLKNLDQLSQAVASALAQLAPTPAKAQPAAAAAAGSTKKQKTEAGEQQQQQQRQQPDPDYDPLRIGPPRRPLRVGGDDVMPLLGGGPGMVGGDPLRLGGVGAGGGGMHVGPGHPFFAGGMRHPDLMPGRGLGGIGGGAPPGVRWDPINPEGLQGWSPDDFQRGGRGPGRGGLRQPGIDPDIGLPGPGRGADWDSMFG